MKEVIDILLISGSIINLYIIALLILKNKINIAIGLAILQAFIWTFKLMNYF